MEYLRRRCPDIALSSDIIVGFPGETEEDFNHTMDVVRQVEYAGIFSFKYSQRKFTAALKMDDDVDEEVKSERLLRLQLLQREIQERLNRALVGSVQEVLVESHSRKDEDHLSGRTPCNRMVNFAGGPDRIGRLAGVRIDEAGPNSLAGILV